MSKHATIDIRLSVKGYKKVAKLLYLGHEIVAAAEGGDRAYHDAIDEVFDQVVDTGLTTLTSLDAINNEADMQEMLFSYREEVAFRWLAINLAIRDTAQEFDLDVEDTVDPENISSDIQVFLLDKSAEYLQRLVEGGPDCIQISQPDTNAALDE